MNPGPATQPCHAWSLLAGAWGSLLAGAWATGPPPFIIWSTKSCRFGSLGGATSWPSCEPLPSCALAGASCGCCGPLPSCPLAGASCGCCGPLPSCPLLVHPVVAADPCLPVPWLAQPCPHWLLDPYLLATWYPCSPPDTPTSSQSRCLIKQQAFQPIHSRLSSPDLGGFPAQFNSKGYSSFHTYFLHKSTNALALGVRQPPSFEQKASAAFKGSSPFTTGPFSFQADLLHPSPKGLRSFTNSRKSKGYPALIPENQKAIQP